MAAWNEFAQEGLDGKVKAIGVRAAGETEKIPAAQFYKVPLVTSGQLGPYVTLRFDEKKS